jgi:hypothetical protein
MVRRLFAKILFFSIVLAGPSLSAGQISETEFQKVLREKAGFREADLRALEKAEPVVKLLPGKEKKEIIVCGIVRLGEVSDTPIVTFRDSLTQRKTKSMLAGEEFSSPPVLNDLQSLKLEKSDFESLRKCRDGDCGLRLSANLLERLRTEFDLKGPDYQQRITEAYRQDVLDLVNAYLTAGNEALGRYNKPKSKIDLVKLSGVLLEDLPLAGDLAPEFVRYLRDFPGDPLTVADSKLNWSKIDFGLKPMVTVSHTVTYDASTGGRARFLIATKQIYASRYVDSSLAVSMLVDITGENAVHRYVIFTDVSRSDELGGLFGGFKRSLVGDEAVDRVKEMLKTAKMRLETVQREDGGSEPPSDPAISAEGKASRIYLGIIGLAVAGALFFLLYRKAETRPNR